MRLTKLSYYADLNIFDPTQRSFFINAPLMDEEYFQILLFSIFAATLGTLLVFLSYSAVTQKPDPEKLSAYECGFEPFGDARTRFDVQFYVVALLFVLFDIEVIFIMPWCLSLAKTSMLGFWAMIEFLLELGLGFAYAWAVGALDW